MANFQLILEKYLDTQMPETFVFGTTGMYDIPEVITLDGILFNHWNTLEHPDYIKNEVEYVQTYKTSVQATNGTYPLFDIAVKQKTRKVKDGAKKVTYEFVKNRCRFW